MSDILSTQLPISEPSDMTQVVRETVASQQDWISISYINKDQWLAKATNSLKPDSFNESFVLIKECIMLDNKETDKLVLDYKLQIGFYLMFSIRCPLSEIVVGN